MKVRLLTGLSGANGSFAPGDEYSCDLSEAGRLVSRGYAEYIREEMTETAVVEPIHETAKRRRRK
ncbi:hypothetical protein [Novosphingobium sp. KN65.2]|uniref:hypothetical protein n=1 Tax=Novosphingobium sp. KN65.2 TaxID=1478134 RepID=UPI0005E518AB|nr:hypothetical protein [Novosphingobium sp. KN65.2]CDO37139.1 p007 [Novosphingobium sp. KN65.2]